MQHLDLWEELKRLAPGTLGLNLVLLLLVSAVNGFSLAFALGLLVGTALLAADLFLLSRIITGAMGKSVRAAQVQVVSGYLLRLLLIGIVFYLAVQCPLLSHYGVVIPLLYPRLIYVWQARRIKRNSQ